MSGYLELDDGGLMAVRDGLVLGRVSACDIVVRDNKASRRHARVLVEGGVVEIEDLGSSNGTLLNGKPVERRMLRDGDEVRIGKTVIVFREGPMPTASGTSAKPSGGAAAFDDDDDLLGSDDLDAGGAVPAAAPAADDADDLLGGHDLGASPPPTQPPPPRAPAPTGDVVEFEDEVVEVPKAQASPPRAPEPRVEVRRAEPAKRAAGPSRSSGGGADEVVAGSGRILQYSKKSGGANPLGDDLAQMSGTMRLLVVLAVVALGAAVVWGISYAMQ